VVGLPAVPSAAAVLLAEAATVQQSSEVAAVVRSSGAAAGRTRAVAGVRVSALPVEAQDVRVEATRSPPVFAHPLRSASPADWRNWEDASEESPPVGAADRVNPASDRQNPEYRFSEHPLPQAAHSRLPLAALRPVRQFREPWQSKAQSPAELAGRRALQRDRRPALGGPWRR